MRKYKDSTFQGHTPAFDGEKNLYSRIKLPVGNGDGAVSEISTSQNIESLFYTHTADYVSFSSHLS